MNEDVEIMYYGRNLKVSKEVATYLAKAKRDESNAARVIRRHEVPLKYFDPDTTLDTKHCTGRNYLLNVVRDNERRWIVRDVIKSLPDNMQRLYLLRYGRDMTQQAIADIEGVSKMAICKRLKKLHEKVRKALPDWPESDLIIER